MGISKNKIKTAVSSSFIRRSSDTAEQKHNNSKMEYHSLAPYDDPIVEDNLEIHNIEFLSKTEHKILNKINSLICDKTNKTNQIYVDEFSKEIGHPVSTLKKTIQKLEKKGLVVREFFKVGRGGWSIYSICQDVRDKLETN